MNKPFTEQQLLDLGFKIYYKKKNGQQVLDYCEYGGFNFYHLPTFYEIIQEVKHWAAENERQKIKDKIAEKWFA
jgi:hypothetical protein